MGVGRVGTGGFISPNEIDGPIIDRPRASALIGLSSEDTFSKLGPAAKARSISKAQPSGSRPLGGLVPEQRTIRSDKYSRHLDQSLHVSSVGHLFLRSGRVRFFSVPAFVIHRSSIFNTGRTFAL